MKDIAQLMTPETELDKKFNKAITNLLSEYCMTVDDCEREELIRLTEKARDDYIEKGY